jgi:hypothetical protein
MQVDIAAETLKVGNAMASVRIDQMILNLAKGIAWGQYELDKVGVDITKMMGVPGTVSIGGENISMLEAGFIPSFYHFVDTILELKMEVHIREEQSTHMNYKDTMEKKMEVEAGVEVSTKAKAKIYVADVEAEVKAHWKQKASSAYSRSVDAGHSQKFSQDLSATSLMRTKIVPVPPPEILVERIKILLEKLRKEAETEVAEQGFLGVIPFTDDIGTKLSTNTISDDLKDGFKDELNITLADNATVSAKEGETNLWNLTSDKNVYRIKKIENSLKVYIELKPEEKKDISDILFGKVEERLMERVGNLGA